MRHATSRLILLFLLLLAIVQVGCSSPRRGKAVPADLQDRAAVLGLPRARSWADELSEEFMAELTAATLRESARVRAEGANGSIPPANYLAISGGGADGAYGAGLLCGWSAAGNRPEFKAVTGISTGALTAPFAFLGPAYDHKLRKVYTSVTTRHIARPRGLLAALFDDALMDTKPLRALLEETVDDKMITEIAAEYARGRILLIATTNLDAGRAVVWNIGVIATAMTPESRRLIRNILIASASIPAAFPPVMIDVQIDGKKYQEMHVDGGATAQVFLYPPTLRIRDAAEAVGIHRERRAYIVRNARLDAHWIDVKRRTLPIARRAISSLIQTQGIGDLYRIYAVAQRDGVEFNLTSIPPEFNIEPKEEFDGVYMRKLFEVGFNAAGAADTWTHRPPGLTEEQPTPSTGRHDR